MKPWRYLFAGFALVLLVALFYAEENWRGRKAWDRYSQAAAARGEPVRIPDLVPPIVPDEENFAMTPLLAEFTKINGLQDFLKEFGAASAAVNTRKTAGSNSWISGPTDLRAWHEAFRTTQSNEVQKVSSTTNEKEAAVAVLEALSVYDPIVDELHAASARPHSRFDLQYNSPNPAAILLPHLARIKGLCQMLQLRASAELAAGKSDQALATVKLALRAADSIRDEPLLISQLVRIACVHIVLRPVAEGLANHRWNDLQLAELAERLGQFDFCASGYRALQGEKAFALGIIDFVRDSSNRWRAFEGLVSSSGSQGQVDPRAALLAAVPKGWFYFEQVNSAKTIDSELLPSFDLTHRRFRADQCREAEQRIDALIGGSTRTRARIGLALKHRLFVGLFLPSVGKAVYRCAFTQAAVDSAMVGCGLERFRLAHGDYPGSLEALVPKFLNKVTRDVITGEPLKYKRTSDGEYVIYSVGWNQADDGGAVAINKSGQGVDPQRGDWVWRLPKKSPDL